MKKKNKRWMFETYQREEPILTNMSQEARTGMICYYNVYIMMNVGKYNSSI